MQKRPSGQVGRAASLQRGALCPLCCVPSGIMKEAAVVGREPCRESFPSKRQHFLCLWVYSLQGLETNAKGPVWLCPQGWTVEMGQPVGGR